MIRITSYNVCYTKLLRSGAGEAEKDTIQTQIDKLSDNKKAYYFQFAQNNRQNVVGEMVINMTKGFFTTEQKQELGIQDN